MSTILDLVKLDSDTNLKLKLLDIREKIITKAKQIIHIFKDVTNKNFIKYICKLVEVEIKKSFKRDKLQFLFLIFNGIEIELNDEKKRKLKIFI